MRFQLMYHSFMDIPQQHQRASRDKRHAEADLSQPTSISKRSHIAFGRGATKYPTWDVPKIYG